MAISSSPLGVGFTQGSGNGNLNGRKLLKVLVRVSQEKLQIDQFPFGRSADGILFDIFRSDFKNIQDDIVLYVTEISGGFIGESGKSLLFYQQMLREVPQEQPFQKRLRSKQAIGFAGV